MWIKIDKVHGSLFRDILFVRSETLATRTNNPRKLNYAIWTYLNIRNTTEIKSIIINIKIINTFIQLFFMLSTVKSFEILPKHNGYGFVLEFFALYWYYFTALTFFTSISMQVKQNFLFGATKSIEYLASTVI